MNGIVIKMNRNILGWGQVIQLLSNRSPRDVHFLFSNDLINKFEIR